MTPYELLQQARDLIQDPAHFSEYWPAEDARGPAPVLDPEAIRWDLFGALWKAQESYELTPALAGALLALGVAKDGQEWPSTHAEVLTLLERAMRLAAALEREEVEVS
jgi:hypothetical protein